VELERSRRLWVQGKLKGANLSFQELKGADFRSQVKLGKGANFFMGASWKGRNPFVVFRGVEGASTSLRNGCGFNSCGPRSWKELTYGGPMWKKSATLRDFNTSGLDCGRSQGRF